MEGWAQGYVAESHSLCGGVESCNVQIRMKAQYMKYISPNNSYHIFMGLDNKAYWVSSVELYFQDTFRNTSLIQHVYTGDAEYNAQL